MRVLKRVSAPTFPAVSSTQLREWLRLDPSVDQSTLDLLLGSAVDHVTALTGHHVVSADYEMWIPEGVGTFEIPATNISAISALSYYAVDPDPTDDILDPVPDGTVEFSNDLSCITVLTSEMGPILVRVTAGWIDEDAVPTALRHAIAVYVGAAYDNRHDISEATFQTIRNIVRPYWRPIL